MIWCKCLVVRNRKVGTPRVLQVDGKVVSQQLVPQALMSARTSLLLRFGSGGAEHGIFDSESLDSTDCRRPVFRRNWNDSIVWGARHLVAHLSRRCRPEEHLLRPLETRAQQQYESRLRVARHVSRHLACEASARAD